MVAALNSSLHVMYPCILALNKKLKNQFYIAFCLFLIASVVVLLGQ